MTERGQAAAVLTANTLAFTVCFAVWTMYGVLLTFLADQQVFTFTKAQMGWLIGMPVLTGALFRLPAGMLADRYGGRPVFLILMLFSAAAAYSVSFAGSFGSFLLAGMAFGLAGSTFAVGVAYTSLWFPPARQGTVLGIFGMGTSGAALTPLLAPTVLGMLTRGGTELERWRMLPRIYALVLAGMTVVYWFSTFPRTSAAASRPFRQRLAPLGNVRVWRFGLYYFLTFGGFVALSQWLIPYFVNVYALSVVAAGLLSAFFTLPAGLLRAFGGWLSDRIGARTVMYWVLGGCMASFLLLAIPRMDLESFGEGVLAARSGTVTLVTPGSVEVSGASYRLRAKPAFDPDHEGARIWPIKLSWQEPVVRVGDVVPKRGLLARGYTRIHFHATMAVFTGLVMVAGVLMGMGNGAIYKHIPTYFPHDVGTVGGIVGVLGGLGGFVDPILFGYFLQWTGIWTTNWIFLFALSAVCLIWMYRVVRQMTREHAPEIAQHIEGSVVRIPVSLRVLCPVHATEAQVRVVAVTGGQHPPVVEHCSLQPGSTPEVPCGGWCIVPGNGPGIAEPEAAVKERR